MVKKQLSLDLSTFETLIKGNYLYIDKTQHIYNLVRSGRLHFLARPRRFGKSLLVSTLEELFSGNRELFKGLWIDSSDYSWEKHPVISLDFSTLDSSSPKQFKEDLSLELYDKAKELGIKLPEIGGISRKLKTLVKQLAAKNKVVILIDEYDYPLISNLHSEKIRNRNLEVLKSFFATIKGLDKYLRAFFITGVSQIPKASLFSGLNNPNNISLKPLAATLLGYTKEELITYFKADITHLAQLKNKTEDEMQTMIQDWYNGYQFSKVKEKVYNPFSLHYLFTDNEFANYWFQSATPSFLLEVIKRNNYALENYEGATASADMLNNLNLQDPQLIPLLFQTGYLTIKSYDEIRSIYTLTYPNKEVGQSYRISLLAAVTRSDETKVRTLSFRMEEALLKCDMELMCQVLTAVFARILYQIDKREEAHYHSLLYMFITSSGIHSSQAEVTTNRGSIDLVIDTGTILYVFEIKVDSSPEKALKQIKDRRYYERYLGEKRQSLVLVGLVFNKKDGERTVSCKHEIIDLI